MTGAGANPTPDARVEAAILAAAIGDALGAPFEFSHPAAPAPEATGFVGGGVFDWAPGETTDDTDMLLAVAESLIAHDGNLRPADILDRFLAWYAGDPRDIGGQTARALAWFSRPDERLAPAADAAPRFAAGERGLGNGSLMRTAPLGLVRAGALHRAFASGDTAAARTVAGQAFDEAVRVSAITHDHPTNNHACGFYTTILAALAAGLPPADARELAGHTTADHPDAGSQASQFATLCDEVSPHDDPAWLWTQARSGYVIDTLRTALWACLCATPATAWPALSLVAQGGNDSDTHACVMGAALGARFGLEWLPSWCVEGAGGPDPDARKRIRAAAGGMGRIVAGLG